MKKYTGYIIIVLLAIMFGPKAGHAAPIEFWTSQTQSDRMRTIQLLMDTFQASNGGRIRCREATRSDRRQLRTHARLW
jgi:hypothetical protein